MALNYLISHHPTVRGVKVRWSAIPKTAHPCLLEFRRRVHARCRLCFAQHKDEESAERYRRYRKGAR